MKRGETVTAVFDRGKNNESHHGVQILMNTGFGVFIGLTKFKTLEYLVEVQMDDLGIIHGSWIGEIEELSDALEIASTLKGEAQ